MKVELKIKKEYDLKYIKADFGVRYWEDAYLNGKEDDAYEPKMPCIEDDRWVLEINVDNGQILNWVKGNTACTHYKVCDDGEYTLFDENKNVIKKISSYVPDCFAIDDSGYGDYVLMTIDENGFIQDWGIDQDDIDDMIKNDFNYEE